MTEPKTLTKIFRGRDDHTTPRVTGKPLTFLNNGEYEGPINVHEAVALAVESVWGKSTVRTKIEKTVIEILASTKDIKETMEKFSLTPDECGAIIYYTIDGGQFGLRPDWNIYRILNSLLVKRNETELRIWIPFLRLLLRGLQKLPNYCGTVYRAIDKSVSSFKQYQKGNTVVWVALSSTSKAQSATSNFSGYKEGTFMQIEVCEGKDISLLSFFPDEQEILLLPNTYCTVSDVKIGKSGFDFMSLKQISTPPEDIAAPQNTVI